MRSIRACSMLPLALLSVLAYAQTPLAANHQPPVPLQVGDRLAIIGDSITEQRLYSRMMEEYLTLCRPDLKMDVRQLGWSGETATGFVKRMQQDCLQFKPTVATTCYGMNDHGYRKFEPSIGNLYREQMGKIMDAFQAAGMRVVVGSPGIVGMVPSWVQGAGNIIDMNDGLAHLHNIGLELAQQRHLGFAEVYEDMVTLRDKCKGTLEASGADGVHPGAAGHLAMAYAFLKSFDLTKTDLAKFVVDWKNKKATASAGHQVVSFDGTMLLVHSSRYPFCMTGGGDATNSALAASQFVPFNQDLNRFMLVLKGGTAGRYSVEWGGAKKTFTRSQLEKGVNLAAEFPKNPFSATFETCSKAIAAKQAYETEQIKSIFRGQDFKANEGKIVAATEKERARLAADVLKFRQPVDHAITITPA